MERNYEGQNERIGRRFRQVGVELRKLRSKSCGRIFAQQKTQDTGVILNLENNKDSPEKKKDIQSSKTNKVLSEWNGAYCGWARALVDYVPSPYDSTALSFKAGQLIHLIECSEVGLWWGELDKRRGSFKCVSVEVIDEEENREKKSTSGSSVLSSSNLLASIGLSDLSSRFELNGYDSLNEFQNISAQDLEFLEIKDSLVREKVMTAVLLVRWMTGLLY